MSAASPPASPMRSEARPVPDRTRVDRLLWIGPLAGPVAFLADLLLKYTLVGPSCAAGHKTVLHVVTLAMLLAAVVPAALGWRAWKRLASEAEGEGEWRQPALSRGYFLAMASVALGAYSALAILANAIPGLMLGACQ